MNQRVFRIDRICHNGALGIEQDERYENLSAKSEVWHAQLERQ